MHYYINQQHSLRHYDGLAAIPPYFGLQNNSIANTVRVHSVRIDAALSVAAGEQAPPVAPLPFSPVSPVSSVSPLSATTTVGGGGAPLSPPRLYRPRPGKLCRAGYPADVRPVSNVTRTESGAYLGRDTQTQIVRDAAGTAI